MRSIFNTDIATGKHDTSGYSHYQTKGPASSFGIKNKLPSPQKGDCHIYSVAESCTEEQTVALRQGKAVIKDFVVVNPKP
jgi:carboxypeptidase D